MALRDLLSPKWKHSNPQVRRKAILEMEGPDSGPILRRILGGDPDPDVRITAVVKVADPRVLDEVTRTDPEPGVVEAARNRLHDYYLDQILRDPDMEDGARVGLLDHLSEEALVARVAAEAPSPEVRTAAVERIETPAVIRRITRSNCGLKPGLAAVHRLEHVDDLRWVAKNATNKKVRRAAETKADTLTEGSVLEDPNAPPLAALCERLEALPETVDRPGGAPEVTGTAEEIEADWDRLDPGHRHPLRRRFETARAEVAAALERSRRKEASWTTFTELCEAAEALADRIGETAPEGHGEEIGEELARLESRWHRTDRDPLAEALHTSLKERFDEAAARCRRRMDEGRRRAEKHREFRAGLAALCQRAEKLASEPIRSREEQRTRTEALSDLTAEWEVETSGGGGAPADLRDRFQKAADRFQAEAEAYEAARAEEMLRREKRFHRLCEQVEAAVEATDRMGLEREVLAAKSEWETADPAFRVLKEPLEERFTDACERFFQKQREFWDALEWERWANLNQKTELCVIVEALADSGETPGIAGVVRETQARWKAVGPVSREKSREIRDRFQAACDRVHDRCLVEKTSLFQRVCDLTPFLDREDGDLPEPAGWEPIAEEIKAAQTRWNEIGPLPRGVEKDLPAEFQGRCNAFFERRRRFYQNLDARREENLEEKRRLCEAAEALSGSDDWRAASEGLKDLQRRWKAVGPVPKTDSDALWHRFQAACNGFFDRLEADKPENLRKKQALCDRAEALLISTEEQTDLRPAARKMRELQETWKAVGPVPDADVDDIRVRFRTVCDVFFETYRSHLDRLQSRQAENRRLKEELTEKAERLADATEWRETAETLKSLQKTWKTIGPAPRRAEQELWRRFRGACDAFFERRNQRFRQQDRERLENLRKKEEICAHLEVLARLAVPHFQGPDDRDVPAAEQVRIGLEYKDLVVVPGNDQATRENALRWARKLSARWREAGPVPKPESGALRRRYRRAMDVLHPPLRESGRDESGGTTAGEPDPPAPEIPSPDPSPSRT